MTQSLGGSLIIYDGVRQDYPIESVLDCYLDLCDVINVLDCGPGDVHKDVLSKYKGKIKIIKGDWYRVKGFYRYDFLPREPISDLGTDWHLHLQGDEVLHEDCHGFVRELIETKTWDAYLLRRWNLWTGFDKVIRTDAPIKPIDDVVLRLARRNMSPTFNMLRDSDMMCLSGKVCWDYIDRLPIVHYGLATDWRTRAEKVMRIQGEDFGRPSDVDQRLVASVKDGRYHYEDFPWTQHLMPLPVTHPKYSKKWMENPNRRMYDNEH
jgi:hypothetical protein